MDNATKLRHPRSYLTRHVVFAILFAAIGLCSTYVAFFNIDGSFPRPLLAAAICAAFWSTAILFCVWGILGYYHEHLILAPTHITLQGVISLTTLQVESMTQIRWWGDLITAKSASHRIVIHIAEFSCDEYEREQIIHYFQQECFQDLHIGMDVFEKNRLQAREVIQPSTSIAWFCVLLFFALGVSLTYCWYIGMGFHWLLLGILNFLGGIWYQWRIIKFVCRSKETEAVTK